MILGSIRPMEERVIEALRSGMRRAPTHAKSYFLDALLKTKDRRVLPDVVALLHEIGSISDQAVSVVRKFGGPALQAIEDCHQGQKNWHNGAFIKAVAGIHQLKAVRMLIERLPYTTWEEARGTSLFIAEHFDRYPKSAQKYLEKSMRAMIENPPPDLPGYCLITCLKMVHRLGFQVDPDMLLTHGESSDIPSVRRHALVALEVQEPDPKQINHFRERLYTLLGHDNRDVSLPSLHVLRIWTKPTVPAAKLRDLAALERPNLKEFAFQELSRRKDRKLVTILRDHLGHPLRRVRGFSSQILMAQKNGPETVLEFFKKEATPEVRRELADVMAQSKVNFPDSEIKAMRRKLALGFTQETIDHALLHYLGAKDREGLNAYLIRRSKKLIKDGEILIAINSLQPLVRFRHGNHDARFLLALANFHLAEDTQDDKDRRYQRCIDILSPLSRAHGIDLANKIKKTKSLATSDHVSILRGLCRRGGMERGVCRQISEFIDETQLSPKDRKTLGEIRKTLRK